MTNPPPRSDDRSGVDSAPPTSIAPAAPSAPKRSRTKLALAAGAAVVVLGGVGWSMRGSSEDTTAEVEAEAPDVPVQDGDRIRFSGTFAQRIGLRDAAVVSRSLSPRVQVTGTIVHDPRKVAEVGARIEGRIARLLVVEGDTVDANAPLVEIDSAELGRAQAAVRSARAREIAAKANLEREQRLVAAQVTTDRDAETARAEAESATAERIASELAVRALGGTPEGTTGRLVLRSPIAGRVVQAAARHGQTVAPTDTLVVVADASTVWTDLAVFEGDLGSIRVGDAVQVSPQVDRELVLEGVVQNVGEVIDLETRTATVRVSIDNGQRALRVGQSVSAFIATTGESRSGLTVPREALVRIDGNETVFVMHGPHVVEPRAVVTGARDGTDVAILEGLREGERVVAAGTFLLKSELFR